MRNVRVTKNGTIQISMEAEDAIDAAILEAMAANAGNNPAALKMSYEEGVGTFTVEVR